MSAIRFGNAIICLALLVPLSAPRVWAGIGLSPSSPPVHVALAAPGEREGYLLDENYPWSAKSVVSVLYKYREDDRPTVERELLSPSARTGMGTLRENALLTHTLPSTQSLEMSQFKKSWKDKTRVGANEGIGRGDDLDNRSDIWPDLFPVNVDRGNGREDGTGNDDQDGNDNEDGNDNGNPRGGGNAAEDGTISAPEPASCLIWLAAGVATMSGMALARKRRK